jgi:hypothetical protein
MENPRQVLHVLSKDACLVHPLDRIVAEQSAEPSRPLVSPMTEFGNWIGS